MLSWILLETRQLFCYDLLVCDIVALQHGHDEDDVNITAEARRPGKESHPPLPNSNSEVPQLVRLNELPDPVGS